MINEGETTPVLTADPMPRTRWFPNTWLNHAEHVLRHEHSGAPATPEAFGWVRGAVKPELRVRFQSSGT